MQIVHPVTQQRHRIWYENPAIGRPLRDDGGGRFERMFPRDCREAVSNDKHDKEYRKEKVYAIRRV